MPFAVMIGSVVVGTVKEKNVNMLNAVLARELRKRFKIRVVRITGKKKLDLSKIPTKFPSGSPIPQRLREGIARRLPHDT